MDEFGVEYIKICPKTNEDCFHGQIMTWINVTPINNLGMRKVNLVDTQDKVTWSEMKTSKIWQMWA